MSFTSIITWPFSWLLLTLYEVTANYGVAIILFALVVKIILLPFQMKSKRSTMRTARLTPLMKELEKKHEGNKAKYQEEVAKMYKEEKINPMSGCLWTLIPFPVLIALYSVIRQPFTRLMRLDQVSIDAILAKLTELGHIIPEKIDAYAEITQANWVHDSFSAFAGISDKLVDLDFNFLGLNLGQRPEWNFFMKTDWTDPAIWGPALGLFLIPVISALISYFSMKASNAGQPQMEAQQQQGMMKGMMLMMPLMSVYIGFIMPAALGIYWIANSLFAMIQDIILNKYFNKQLDIEDAERRTRMNAREAELEAKRLETERLRELGATERNKNTSKKKLQAAEKNTEEERQAIERAEEKAARRAKLGIEGKETPASQVGARKYARGRAYVDDRFENPEDADEATLAAAAASDIDQQVDDEYKAMDENDAGEAAQDQE